MVFGFRIEGLVRGEDLMRCLIQTFLESEKGLDRESTGDVRRYAGMEWVQRFPKTNSESQRDALQEGYVGSSVTFAEGL